jgi:hypothetical protein
LFPFPLPDTLMDSRTEGQGIRLFARQQEVMAPTDLSTPGDLAPNMLPAEIVPTGRQAMVHAQPGLPKTRLVSFAANHRYEVALGAVSTLARGGGI